jgi:hypothetical protein
LIPLFAKVGRIEIYYEVSSLTLQFCGWKDEWNINYGSKIINIFFVIESILVEMKLIRNFYDSPHWPPHMSGECGLI